MLKYSASHAALFTVLSISATLTLLTPNLPELLCLFTHSICSGAINTHMLLLINQRPMIDLEPYLDLHSLYAQQLDLAEQLALSEPDFMINSTHQQSFLDPSVPAHQNLVRSLSRDRPDLTARQRDWFAAFQGTASHGFVFFVRNVFRYPEDFAHKHRRLYTYTTPSGQRFRSLLQWIDSQTMIKEYGRVVFFISPPHHRGIAHRDNWGMKNPPVDHFLWISGPITKHLVLFDPDRADSVRSESRAVWFASENYHGSENPTEFWTWSLRIDCEFSQQFLQQSGLSNTSIVRSDRY